MKTIISAAAFAAALSLGAATSFAQASGGPDAKGNAPLKHAHTVNDGAAKPGRNSFTQGQAQKHIEKAGFTGVSGLTKGPDGVWRGQAMRDGQTVNVAMDFKGNVTTESASTSATTNTALKAVPAPEATVSRSKTTTNTGPTDPTATEGPIVHHRRRHHHHHHAMSKCANPTPNGAACSGVDRNHNGISDKEDRAIRNGAKP